ncbi:MAG: DinB family protein, partial [Actinomycetota bacterium]
VLPSHEEVLALRRDRMGSVRRVIEGLSDEALAADTEPVDGAGWPPPRTFPVRECLLTVLNEEYYHRQFAERDLDALETDAQR